MTKVLTLRVDSALLAQAEAKAMRLGLDRAKYVRSLIEDDLCSSVGKTSGFASSDLAGLYEGTAKSATNQETRARMRRKP